MNDYPCDGCLTYVPDKGSSCKFSGYNYDGKCPCTNCIIKMMCGEPCNDYANFRIEGLNNGVSLC